MSAIIKVGGFTVEFKSDHWVCDDAPAFGKLLSHEMPPKGIFDVDYEERCTNIVLASWRSAELIEAPQKSNVRFKDDMTLLDAFEETL